MLFKNKDKDEDYLSYETGKFISREEIIRELALEVQRLKNDNRMYFSGGVFEVKQLLSMLLEYLELDVQESKTKLVKRNEETK